MRTALQGRSTKTLNRITVLQPPLRWSHKLCAKVHGRRAYESNSQFHFFQLLKFHPRTQLLSPERASSLDRNLHLRPRKEATKQCNHGICSIIKLRSQPILFYLLLSSQGSRRLPVAVIEIILLLYRLRLQNLRSLLKPTVPTHTHSLHITSMNATISSVLQTSLCSILIRKPFKLALGILSSR